MELKIVEYNNSSLLDFDLLLKLDFNKAKSVQLQQCWMFLHICFVDSRLLCSPHLVPILCFDSPICFSLKKHNP